jgi:hypothetical protein
MSTVFNEHNGAAVELQSPRLVRVYPRSCAGVFRVTSFPVS